MRNGLCSNFSERDSLANAKACQKQRKSLLNMLSGIANREIIIFFNMTISITFSSRYVRQFVVVLTSPN